MNKYNYYFHLLNFHKCVRIDFETNAFYSCQFRMKELILKQHIK